LIQQGIRRRGKIVGIEKYALYRTEEMLKEDIMITSLYKSYLNFHIYGSIKWWSFQRYLRRLRANKISASWVTYNPKYDISDLILTYSPKEVVDITTPKGLDI